MDDEQGTEPRADCCPSEKQQSRREFLKAAGTIAAAAAFSARPARLLSTTLGAKQTTTAQAAAASDPFSGTGAAGELLICPTNTSINVSVLPAADVQYYYEYGTTSGSYPNKTSTVNASSGSPSVAAISGLSPDTKYYYRLQYSTDSGSTWTARTEHSLRTARAAGETFAFTITSDGHNMNTSGTFSNILSEQPDFNVDLGDTFMLDSASTQSAANTACINQRASSLFGGPGVSVPMFVAPGNHEQEEGWHFTGNTSGATPQAPLAINARKSYFPAPIPGTPAGSFYSCNTDTAQTAIAGDHYRADYYAWTWGDALFVVIDPFQYTLHNSYGNVAGDGSSEDTKDQWDWTLGQQQYNWLKTTLENSNAKYKFLFSHNMVGGCSHSESGSNYPGYVRGGAECAAFFEWGGYSTGTNSYDFDTKRPGWGVPIEQLLIANHTSAYFHGHDHQFAYETRDGIVYQEVPPAGTMSAFAGCYTAGTHTDPAGSYNTVNVQNSSQSHLKLTVTPSQTTVNLMNASGSSIYSYTIAPYTSGTGPSVTIDQASGTSPQADPTASSPIHFTAVFSAAVTGFTASDVTLSGTAGATTAAVTDSGDHKTYDVAVSGMTKSGTVIASIAAGVAQDASSNPNLASSSTDNTVTYARTQSVALATGWNLVAGAAGTTFPSELWAWDGTEYESASTGAAWQGFWCEATSAQSVNMWTVPGPKTITLTAGWNLIGNCMSTAAALTLPSGTVAWVYDTTAEEFVSATSLRPGQGAFVEATATGQQVTLTPS